MAEPEFGRGGEIVGAAAPVELQAAGMKGVRRQNKARALGVGQAPLHERQIQVGVATIEFVAHNGMPQVLQVNPDLMLAAGAGQEAQQGEGRGRGQRGRRKAESGIGV